MKKYNSPTSIFRQMNMSMEEYAKYKRDIREYNLINDVPLKGIELRKFILPMVRFVVKLFRLSKGHSLEIINDKRIKTSNPCIFAVTHIGMFDIERVFESIKTSCWIFNGDPETVYRNFDGFALNASGVILIDTDSKTDRKVALETAIRLLKSGGNLMFFPEGIWNVEESIPVLNLFPGILQIATKSGADIIPVAIEQYDNHFQVHIGENIPVEKIQSFQNDCAALQYLRNEMASLKWNIYETHADTRKNFKDVSEYQKQRIISKLYEWIDKNGNPYYNESILKERQFKPKGQFDYDTVFAHLEKIKPNKNTAFLFNKRLK